MKNQQLEQLFKLYSKPLYYFLWKLSGSSHLAEDLTQETFVRATISLHTYQGEQARAWLFKVARNIYIDEWRKRKRRESIPLVNRFKPAEEMISPYGLPEDTALAQEQRDDLNMLFDYLPERYRTILYLREVAEFSYSEIANAMDLSVDQVKVTLHRSRKKLETIAQQKGWHDDRME
ncbi:sigma-70 family RNA polymerase sigma factor [Planococcus sp. CP5-4]|uniref:sigma-70 family RNA polymerase sigma factor n=1 Tax=unclassified Planococcus (in: firmicutes) TaxID=2662419 RepID=UPI001C221E50|nr:MULTISPECIES: sigma-70 family RNA polymerase sigma factor [unclassified Planococcus (in: firmicutes)]MBU9675080.1 sigma-70 family RNA polymerase sigma factor [Planococcus sp. CP5-4_YE]MBV0910169.1 sigma-70 family RNA polymerase sigma factor [Planococcus sp. CP5-4_UN]MBW6064624.1 sigma-70 family RNA polymerase sigma factor [Planococcus sp. CP5-4]